MSTIRVAFAGNRNISTKCLDILLEQGITPVALLVPGEKHADVADQLQAKLPNVPVFVDKYFRTGEGVAELQSLEIDYLLSIHFPYIITKEVLAIPKEGTLNLHPAYLPYNKGWHTPSWAIEEGTPYGATLHWVDEGIDSGDIALQKEIEILPTDTADSLYKRVLDLEVEVFTEALPMLIDKSLPHIKQVGEGTTHSKKDLATIQKIEPDMDPEDVTRRVRALTTNNPEEAAYMEVEGQKVSLQLNSTSTKSSEVPE